MSSNALQILRELEAHYVSNLQRVRELIQTEGGSVSEGVKVNPIPLKAGTDQSDLSRLSKPDAVEKAATDQSDLSRLHKGDAVEKMFRAMGDMHKERLFQELKKHGHPIASSASLNVTLSKDKRFESKGAGIWGLAHSTNGTTASTDSLPFRVPEIHSTPK
jgi:hypothetical protein